MFSKNHTSSCQRTLWPFCWCHMRSFSPWHDVSSRFGSLDVISPLNLTKILFFFFGNPAPIAWPIAKLLDWVLGTKEHHTYKKAELKSFLQFHQTGDEPLRDDEITILNGVLELNTKKVEAIMTPLKVCLFFFFSFVTFFFVFFFLF